MAVVLQEGQWGQWAALHRLCVALGANLSVPSSCSCLTGWPCSLGTDLTPWACWGNSGAQRRNLQTVKFLPTSMADFMQGPEAQQPLMDVWPWVCHLPSLWLSYL